MLAYVTRCCKRSCNFIKNWPDLSLKAGMRVDVNEIHRSAVYYLISTVIPINHALKAKLDIYGSVIVVVLTVGLVTLMRLLLGGTH